MKTALGSISRLFHAASLALSLCLVSGMALAFSGSGSGTTAAPYVIMTVDQLQEMADDVTAHYVLGDDIDASATPGWNSGAGFEPVGTDGAPFVGSFDGQDHTITGLFIDRSSTYYVGLFGLAGTTAASAPLSNVSFAAVDITGYCTGALVGEADNGAISNCHVLGGTVSGDGDLGGLVGYARVPVSDCSSAAAVSGSSICGGLIGYSYDDVTRCHATGDVTANNGQAGGLIAWAGYAATTECSASGSVTSPAGNWGRCVGGLIGGTESYHEIHRCKATGDVSADEYAGGLVGYLSYASSYTSIYDSYASGSASANWYAGGLVGYYSDGEVERCYATGVVTASHYPGGLVGDAYPTATDSFWDVDASGLTTSDGGTGKSMAEMKQQATFDPPWDFSAVWGIVEGFSYPYLLWEDPPCEGAGPRDIVAGPTSVDFGSQGVNQGATTPSTITIINMGGADLTISSVAISGDAAFAVVSDSGEGTLGACTIRTVAVAFDPSSLGTVSANLVIASDDPDTPSLNVALEGTGTNTAPVVGVYPAGSCLDFRAMAGDRVACGSDASLAITGDLTIETWVQYVQTGSPQTLVCWAGAGETEAENVLYQIHTTDIHGGLVISHETGAGVDTEYTFDTNLANNQWYHIAVVRDATAKTYTLYLDGAYFDAWTYTDGPTGGGSGACYLASGASSGDPLFGRLDDVRVWDTVRTGSEIQAGMNREYDGDEPGLAGYWKLNEGTGITTADATANGNDGTLEGSPSWVTPSEVMGGYTTTPTRYTDEETDLAVALEGTDADGDVLAAYVTQLAGAGDGALYQYDGGARGALIDTVDTLVTDAERRVIYAPADKDAPYTATLGWRVFDGLEYSAGSGTLTIEVDAEDATPPTAVISLVSSSPTGADSIDFQVAFDEPVAPTFDVGDVSLDGTLTGAIGISGADPTYTVTVTPGDADADGTLGIVLAGGGAVTDLAGNPFAGGASALCEVVNWHTPYFTQEPAGARLYAGDAHTLTAAANCAASVLNYQWKWNDDAKTVHDVGGDAPTLMLPDMTGLAGDYWCEATYDGVTHASNTATLQVRDHLAITVQPTGGDYVENDAHTFWVITGGGYLPLTYTWKKDGYAVWTEADYTIDPLSQEHAGAYTVEISDDNGDVAVSAPPVELTVGPGVPTAGWLGLGILAILLSLAAVHGSRRAFRGAPK